MTGTVVDGDSLRDRALGVLKTNDRGAYTIPTSGLYPFQWNWDSCFTAIGWAHFNQHRAWVELETLFAHQWPDGMVPHIVFHVHDDGYFPGPEIWRTGRAVATSGITQPPVAGMALKRLYQMAADREAAAQRGRVLVERVHRWHEFLYTCRDPRDEGLVAIIHPWEAGRDNSVDWDEALARVPTIGVQPYRRRDTQHASSSQRPTSAEYDRYIWLVQHFRALAWNNIRLHDESPFQVVDPGFNAILARACLDVAEMASVFGMHEIAEESRRWGERTTQALESLWSEEHGRYLCYDRKAGEPINSASVGGIVPVIAPIPSARIGRIARTITDEADLCTFLLPSHAIKDPRFNAQRYWRGPVWLIINYLVARGLREAGSHATADLIVKSSLDLITNSGFAEYYNPLDGKPLGGRTFTWTAAVLLELLAS